MRRHPSLRLSRLCPPPPIACPDHLAPLLLHASHGCGLVSCTQGEAPPCLTLQLTYFSVSFWGLGVSVPNSPSTSLLMPAVKYSAFGSVTLSDVVGKRRPHSPAIVSGSPSVFRTWPRNSPLVAS